MRALVVGASGFVGQYLVRHLIEEGDEVFATTHAGASLDGLKLTAFPLDITKSGACTDLIHRVQPDVVYHLAAIAFVPEAEADFERTILVNVAGTSNIIRSCHLQGRGITVLLASSAEVYGHVAASELPVRESNEPRPANNYSLSKRMAELVAERYGRGDSLRTVIVRPFNHIGPGQDSRFVASNFAYQLASIALGLTSPIIEVGNLDARRDFSDVRDIVRAYRRLASSGTGVYNLGTGRAVSIQQLLDTLISISGVGVEVRRDPDRMRGPEVFELYASYARAREETGWEPVIPIEQSLRDVYRYWYDRLAIDRAI